MTRVVPGVLALAASALCACGSPSGALYTRTVVPLTTNFDTTPVVTEMGRGDVKQLEYYVRVLWSGNGIGEVAKTHGFREVYYADLETFSVLGIWTQRWAHVYGRR